MNGVNKISLFVLCASFLGGVVMAYRGMNGTSDSLVFGGWLIALIAVGIGAAWVIIGQNPFTMF
jgi:hypothetical protein